MGEGISNVSVRERRGNCTVHGQDVPTHASIFILTTSIFSPADQSGNEFGCQELMLFLNMFETGVHLAPINS